MRGSCDLWAAGLSGGRWGSGHHHECDYEQQEEKRWEQSAASYGGQVRPIKGHVLRGHASRLTLVLTPPPATGKPPVETGTGGAEVCFWCACGVGLWITLRWGYEGVRRRGVVKLNIAGGTHLFSWGEKTTMTRWWCVIRGHGTPVATPTHVPRKIRAITNPRSHLPPRGIMVGANGAEILETWSTSLWCFRRCWSLGCGQNPHNFHNQNS